MRTSPHSTDLEAHGVDPQGFDPLGEALHFLRLTGAFYCRSTLTAPFGLALPSFPGSLMFHVVTSGHCTLRVNDQACELSPGDLALVPHGQGHRLVSAPDVEVVDLFDLPREEISSCFEILEHGGPGEATTMLCGLVDFDHPAAKQVIGVLPDVVRVDAWGSSEADWLHSTLRFMSHEARQMRPGGETIITRLCDVLVILAIRAWLAEDPAARQGWLGALHDKHIGRAIAAVHRNPEQSWTVASLAGVAAMSRSGFSARFAELVGEAPLKYVTRWRMHLAHALLREGKLSVEDVAQRLGYQSVAAFSRAFKRVIGVSPGAERARETAHGTMPRTHAASGLDS